MADHLAPVHPSMVNKRRTPRGFGTAPDGRQFCEKMALEVFTAMTMNGHTFVAALGAIYATGIHDAMSARKDVN